MFFYWDIQNFIEFQSKTRFLSFETNIRYKKLKKSEEGIKCWKITAKEHWEIWYISVPYNEKELCMQGAKFFYILQLLSWFEIVEQEYSSSIIIDATWL